MTDRTVNYDALIARENEARERIAKARERIAKARHTISIQLGTGTWNLHQIDHILTDDGDDFVWLGKR